MDSISIRGLRLKARIGVTEEERAAPREVVVDVYIRTDTSRAGATDDLADTVDYAGVIDAVSEVVEEGEVKLLERLAEKIASRVGAFGGVDGVTVQVTKRPPVEQDVDAVAVTVERRTP